MVFDMDMLSVVLSAIEVLIEICKITLVGHVLLTARAFSISS